MVIKRFLLLCVLLTTQQVVVDAQWTPPAWWDLISDTFKGNLKRCFKRQVPPVNGTRCARTPKTCFFGDKQCESVGHYPEVQCDCEDRVWTCDDSKCPEPPENPNSCPYVHNNSPDCPATKPPLGTICESASLVGGGCTYGEKSWYDACMETIFPAFVVAICCSLLTACFKQSTSIQL